MFTKGQRSLGILTVLGTFSIVAGSGTGQPVPKQRDMNALVAGLRVWRKPGAIDNGAACATCHSPDGIELAVYKFDDKDIIRRASPHLGVEDSQLLVDYIHALREKFHITKLRDPMEDRPLQPGGSVLPGMTPAERDYAFGKELADRLPLLFGPTIETIEQAKAAEHQLLDLDPVNLKIGIPFNRISEDIVHGKEHASIADWLPDVPPIIPQPDLASWYETEDRYLESPTATALKELLQRHQKLVDPSRTSMFGAISFAKYRALLILQDRIRHDAEQTPLFESTEVTSLGMNPIWEVAQLAREAAKATADTIGMGPDIAAKKDAGTSLGDQLRDMRLSWSWAGWLSDQSQMLASYDSGTRLGLWLSTSLSVDGPYPIHNIYANARRQAIASNRIDARFLAWARDVRIWDFAGIRAPKILERDIPVESGHRALYAKFATNCILMNLLLLKQDIAKTKDVYSKKSEEARVLALSNFVTESAPNSAHMAKKIAAELIVEINSAHEHALGAHSR